MPGTCLICGLPSPYRCQLCHTHRERWRRWGCPPVEGWATRFRENRLSTCCICGKSFNGYRNRTTCADNPECELERRRRAALDRWNNLPPNRKREASERASQLSREKHAKLLGEKPCRLCGTKFIGFPKQTLCSPECRHAYRNMKSAEWRARQRSAEQLDKLTLSLESRNGTSVPCPDPSNPQPGDGA